MTPEEQLSWEEDKQRKREEARERRAKRLEENLKLLRESEFVFETRNDSTVLLFRIPGKPMVDYYPSTNTWRTVGGDKQVKKFGRAPKFLKWFRAQKVQDQVFSDWEEAVKVAKREGKTIVRTGQNWMLK